jgi:hypothetical protein
VIRAAVILLLLTTSAQAQLFSNAPGGPNPLPGDGIRWVNSMRFPPKTIPHHLARHHAIHKPEQRVVQTNQQRPAMVPELHRLSNGRIGIMTCPSEWDRIIDGNLYCLVPMASAADVEQQRVELRKAEETLLQKLHGTYTPCAPGYELACDARDHGTDGLRRSNPKENQQ